GDSDFSPLVHKLRELDKRVIGVGVEKSTSRLLPSACDEFLFYDRLEGVEVPDESESRPKRSTTKRSGSGRSTGSRATTGRSKAAAAVAEDLPPAEEATPAAPSGTTSTGRTRRKKPEITLPEPVDVPDRAPEPA